MIVVPKKSIRSGDAVASSLVERANDWLSKNKDMHIRNCETLMRMSTTKKTLYDPEQIVLTSSMSENMQTHHLRGLRFGKCLTVRTLINHAKRQTKNKRTNE
ncbi:hypothetical protein LSAT2_011224 [Lamellibrachia satsuma]|nr:hypothetical protein LSAT2_030079 [Lamellibrachia satsuma]KAI0238152.1 hypothetical protein LSAT2_011224 [Lamellibrachia satsuma]